MYESSDDESLMALYIGGDEVAFRALYGRYRKRVYGFLSKRVYDATAAEELCQTTLLKLHRSRGRYREGELFAAWVFLFFCALSMG